MSCYTEKKRENLSKFTQRVPVEIQQPKKTPKKH